MFDSEEFDTECPEGEIRAAQERVDPDLRTWQDSKPRWQPIAGYNGGKVLLRFGESMDNIVHGMRKPHGIWVQFSGGQQIRFDADYTETFCNLDDPIAGPMTRILPGRHLTNFCEITPEMVIHLEML